jgi:outer membrane lipoprotein-sorting protein
MNLKNICLLAVNISLTMAVTAQTADEIIAKHIEATGGKEKLGAINSVRIESTMHVMDNDGPNKIIAVNGKGYRTESDFNGQTLVQVYTDKSGWAINPFSGGDAAAAMPDDQYKTGAGLVYIIPLLNYAARGEKAELLGKEKIGNADAYKIKITDKNNISTTWFIDPSTYNLVQSSRPAQMMGETIDVITTYSDFKKLDYGWVLPQSTEISYGGQFSMTSKVNKVEVNPAVDASVFEMKKLRSFWGI